MALRELVEGSGALPHFHDQALSEFLFVEELIELPIDSLHFLFEVGLHFIETFLRSVALLVPWDSLGKLLDFAIEVQQLGPQLEHALVLLEDLLDQQICVVGFDIFCLRQEPEEAQLRVPLLNELAQLVAQLQDPLVAPLDIV